MGDGDSGGRERSSVARDALSKMSGEQKARYDEAPLDFSPASGATDPLHAARDANASAYSDRGQIGENQTQIGGDLQRVTEDGDLRDLKQLNRDTTTAIEGESIERLRDRDKLNDLRAWGRFIELSDYEIERAEYLFELVDSPTRWGNSLEAAILAALTIAANEDMGAEPPKIIRQSAEQVAKTSDDLEWYSELVDHYETLREDLGVERSAVRNVRKRIQQRM